MRAQGVGAVLMRVSISQEKRNTDSYCSNKNYSAFGKQKADICHQKRKPASSDKGTKRKQYLHDYKNSLLEREAVFCSAVPSSLSYIQFNASIYGHFFEICLVGKNFMRKAAFNKQQNFCCQPELSRSHLSSQSVEQKIVFRKFWAKFA